MTDKTYPEGTYYPLPEGVTWEGMTLARRKWEINPRFCALACAPGVVAWGTPTDNTYRNINEEAA